MKVNVEIDCTPLEARQFFGLPDVGPMQTAVMEKLQQQMMSNIDKVSPESLLQILVHLRSQDRRTLSGHVRRHGRPRRLGQEGQEIGAVMDESAGVTERRLRPPSLFLMLAEARGLFELNSSLRCAPLLMRAPRGDGHPVLTLPGFLASDLSMAPMRRYLKALGYDAHAWNMGRNLGGVASKRAALRDLVRQIYEATGRKVSIVGWSLGGIYARDLALQCPEMVRSVITLGSPFTNDIRATNATRLYEALSGEGIDDIPEIRQAIAGDLPVPATSIYSRTDGIVNWRTCVLRPSATAENIEVYFASHIGLGVNPAALWAVADRLALAEGEFKQFDRSGPFAIAYAPPENAQS